ncbi:L-threonine 3-dehydrogenase [Streptomyces alboniger]
MKAAVIESVGRAVVAEVPDPTPGPREVVVEVAACGLCGTDLHILQGEFAPKLPIVPGHEFAGEVVGVGTQVTEVAVGDRVAVDPSLYCYECRYCRTGHNNLCERWAAIGVTTAGGAAQFAVAPVANCVKLPEHVRTQDAALVEPLSCAVRGYDVLQSRLGAHVLIYGSGTMGLMMLELAKRTGAASVDMVDINEQRLATAQRLGVSSSATGADELDRPQGWDLVVDATGNAAAIQDGLGPRGQGGHVPPVRRRRLRDAGDDRPVPHLQPGDHHHRLDGGPAQLRAGGGTVRERCPGPGGLHQRPHPAGALPGGTGPVQGRAGAEDRGGAVSGF